MGLMSLLGTIGGFAAAPFTGGASIIPGLLSAAGDIGSVVGKQEQGKAQGKAAQANLQQEQDRNALASYAAQQNAQNQAGQLDLSRQQFAQNSRGTNARDAVIGALLGGGVMPTSISPTGASGGLLRSLNGNPDALAALKTLGSQGSMAQQTPLQFAGGNILQAPKLTPLPNIDQGGIMSLLARIGEIAGAASPYVQPRQNQQAQSMPEAIAGLPFVLPGQDTGIPEGPAPQQSGLDARTQQLLRNVRL